MVPFLTILAIAFFAWRYRKILGLDRTWDRYGREHADDLAARLGWRAGSDRAHQASGQRTPVPRVGPHRTIGSHIDSRWLPAALLIGAVEALVIVVLEIQDHSFLSSMTSLLVGPFVGGVYLRSRWWMLVAAAIAVVVGSGGRLGPFVVAFPVAVIAYAGIRTDVRSWIAKRFEATDEPQSPSRP